MVSVGHLALLISFSAMNRIQYILFIKNNFTTYSKNGITETNFAMAQ